MFIPSPLFNCQQATLLIERRADEVLPLKTNVQLWAYLRLCPYESIKSVGQSGSAASSEKYPAVARQLRTGLSVRNTAKLCDMAINTVRKVKALL